MITRTIALLMSIGSMTVSLAQTPAFHLTSPVVTEGGALPVEFTGDGAGISPPLAWEGAPVGTKSFALSMHHLDPEGKTKWYWTLYDLPAGTASLPKGTRGLGTWGTNSVNDRPEYAPPHSKGPGLKKYTLTLYALSAQPPLRLPASPVTRAMLLEGIKDRILGTADLNVTYTRP